MDTIGIIAAILFGFGYLLITLEQRIGTHKSALALCMGAVLWMLAAVKLQAQPEVLDHAIESAGSEIFGIVAFLLAAMALIEILVHYRFFDLIRARLIAMNVGDKQQFLLIMLITFFASAVLDNIAITIAMLQIARRFFTGRNMLVAAAGIVIAANAGGAWSPIGDVTTILLWLAEKFTVAEVVMYTFFPSFVLFLVSTSMLYRKLDNDNFLKREQGDLIELSLSERLIVGTALVSFSLPLFMNAVIGLPPYIGLLFGLGLTWLMIEVAKRKSRHEHQSHLTANIEKLIQTVDLSSIKFIMGILLSVSALAAIGVLSFLSTIAVGEQPSDLHLIYVNIAIGLLSSIVDNSSLVAVAINVLPTTDPELWTLTALTAGTGGSIFVIASAAGVVAMGSFKQLTFQNYFKIATVPALAGFVAGVAVWLLQYWWF